MILWLQFCKEEDEEDKNKAILSKIRISPVWGIFQWKNLDKTMPFHFNRTLKDEINWQLKKQRKDKN